MPRTPLGIYYPRSDENIQGSIAVMMDSIDTAVNSLKLATDTVDYLDGILIIGPSYNATHGSKISIDFTGGSVSYDTGGYWDPLNPTRVTLSPGWWMVSVNTGCSPSSGTLLSLDVAIRSNNYTIVAEHQVSDTGGDGDVMFSGLYCKPDTTDYLYLEVLFLGSSGGLASVDPQWFRATKIGDL